MLAAHLRRGLAAGAVGGVAYGLFAALVGTNLVAHAETFEGAPATTTLARAAAGGGAGVVWGLLLGVAVFGAAYYLLEPAIPGAPDTRSYLLAGAGFLVVSGAPWLALPPRPPGVEPALPTGTRIAAYAGMMAVGALACGLSGYAYARLSGPARPVGAALPFALLGVAALAPPTPVSGPVPGRFAAAFRWTVVAGQVGLWIVLASAHAWLGRRDADPGGGA